MDRVHEELEDAKAEIEKLKEECRSKAEQSDNLKRAHNEQIIKIREMSSKLEKQNQDLIEKADEISVFKKMYEDLECDLKEKESIIKRLSYQNDKLRVDSQEMIKKCEEEKRELIFLMEEENEKNLEREEKIRALKEENEFLKGRVFELQKAGVEAKERAKMSKELRVRDEVLVKLEEDRKKVEEELKWKKEKFEHLKEAHDKLRGQLESKVREWEKEKCALIDEISTIQENLDSQTRISEDLKSRLEMCKQALAHEESRRRNLEVKVSESTTCFENVFAENEEGKSNLKSLLGQRDKEIAALRDLMGTKEGDYKEMEYRLGKVEKENEELKVSLKELHEDRIREARACTPMYKTRSKTKSKSSESVHKECLKKLKDHEAEWGSQMEKMREELSSYRFELKGKDEFIDELKQELEKMDSSIMELSMKNEESFVMALVLKSVFVETRMKFADENAKMDLEKVEREENSPLVALFKKELDGHKEKVLKMKCEYEQVCDALDRANEELARKFIEANEIEFELQIWKSIAERLKSDLEENYQTRREMEDSLLAQVTVEVNLKEENKVLVNALEQKDRRIEDLESLEMGSVYEAWEKMKTNEVLKEMEIQENRLVFQELEKDSRKKEEIEGELEEKELEVKKLTHLILDLFDKISKVSNEDNELMGELGRIVEISGENEGEELFESEKENAKIRNFIAIKKVDANLDGRSPLRALNS